MDTLKLQDTLIQFDVIPGDYQFSSLGDGLIHQTYLAKGATGAYILQRLNTKIFPKPSDIMHNIEKAVELLDAPDYMVPAFLSIKEGTNYLYQDQNDCWRAMNYIPNSTTVTEVENAGMAYEAGLILGRFHRLMTSARPEEFRIILPEFHQLENHWGRFQNILETATSDRIDNAEKAIHSANEIYDYLAENKPIECRLRVCHNDAKLDNFLFDKSTGMALGLIDLDTLMPGFFYFDFGDAMRDVGFSGSEKDTSTYPTFKTDYIKSMLSGLNNSGLELEVTERLAMPYGAVLMPFLHGLRALTDFLDGNRYYKVNYSHQNLDRATYLLQVAEEAMRSVDKLNELVSN